jgi:cytidine deaminase
MDIEGLLAVARDAQGNAHVPYSGYAVGVALETGDGSVYDGCNIEVANYSNTLHAEEVALVAALKDGHEEFTRLVVSSRSRDGVTPCGMCRQTLAEFCGPDLDIYCDHGDDLREYTLGELLPGPITEEMVHAGSDKSQE